MLHGVLALGRPLDRQLDRQLAGLGASDRALAHSLAIGVLRHLPALDGLIDSACRTPPPADSRARMALRIALAGRILLDTPPHAAIATSLPLVEGGPRRLVHGVLSNLFKREGLALEALLPEPWQSRWASQWGEDQAAAAARRLTEVPPTDLCLADRSRTAEWTERLGGVSLMPGHVRLAGSQHVQDLPGFESGDWWVQDVAAQLPARFLGDVKGMRVLDMCAAPGGKTMQLAASGADVVALDISGARLERMKDNLRRTGLSARLVQADARTYQADGRFDAILLDAPCSASGTWRRHPDVLYLKASLDLGPLTLLQGELRSRAATWLNPGGRLIYAVCSLEEVEGEGHRPDDGLVPEPIRGDECPEGLTPTVDGFIRTLPGLWDAEGGADGFFISRQRAP